MNEQADIVSTVMIDLKISEDLQRRVLDYYNKILESKLIRTNEFYNLLSPCRAEFIKLYQIEETVNMLTFINKKNTRQIEKFVLSLELGFYLPDDIILKQGYHNNYFYFVHEGLLEVIQNKSDFLFFNNQEVNKFFKNKEEGSSTVNIDVSDPIQGEPSIFDPSPTHGELFKRQMTK